MRWNVNSGFKYLRRGLQWLRLGGQRWYERRQLQRLDLSDLHLSQADIEREARKHWWQA